MKRRQFLKFLGLAPAAASVSAESLTGIGGGGASIFGSGVATAASYGAPIPLGGTDSALSRAMKVWNFVRGASLPDHVVARLRLDSENVYRLDPDLAVNKSFSLSTKMRVQRVREFDRAVRRSLKELERGVSSAAFAEKTGLELW